MTGKEVADLIVDKGSVTREIFYTIYFTLTIEKEQEKLDTDFIAIFSYNSTIIMMGDILNNPQYYISEIYEINEKDIDVIRKDYESMESIDYPDEYSDIDIDELEQEIEDNFVLLRENEERMEEYYEKNIQ